jgi:hypothetical protein
MKWLSVGLIGVIMISGCINVTGKCPFPDETMPQLKDYINQKLIANMKENKIQQYEPTIKINGYHFYFAGGFSCSQGSKEGENTNYLYCGPTWSDNYDTVSKTLLDSNGTIIEKSENKFRLYFVVDSRTKQLVGNFTCS